MANTLFNLLIVKFKYLKFNNKIFVYENFLANLIVLISRKTHFLYYNKIKEKL